MIYLRYCYRRLLPLGAWAVLTGCFLVASGCDDTTMSSRTGPDPASEEEELGPNVRMRISFDQTERTYTSVWPGAIVGNDKAAGDPAARGGKLITEYERTHEERMYDEDGYLTSEYKFLEGSPTMNMPEAAYEDNRERMPYDPSMENPIVRSELRGSTIRYFREDGSIARSREIDPELFRVSPSKIDSLKEAAEESTVQSRRESKLQQLRQQGISFNRMDENHIRFSQKLPSDRGTNQVQKVVDLRIGRPVYLKYELKNGKTDLVQTRKYRFVSGVPMKVYEVTYDYDDRTGDWGIVARTEIMRKNISVQFR